jgi:hypothetical protein
MVLLFYKNYFVNTRLGDSIAIHGIGLDNLPPVIAEPMKIIDSVGLTRR